MMSYQICTIFQGFANWQRGITFYKQPPQHPIRMMMSFFPVYWEVCIFIGFNYHDLSIGFYFHTKNGWMVLSTSLSLIFTVIIYIYYILFIAIRLLDGHIPDELTFISPSKFGHSDQKKDKKKIIKNDKTN